MLKPAAWMCPACFLRSSTDEGPHDSGGVEDCDGPMVPLFTQDNLVSVFAAGVAVGRSSGVEVVDHERIVAEMLGEKPQ